MAKRVGIGCQDFEDIRKNGNFYIDKSRFIREWWEAGDSVTLLTRPRRFGKTLNMSMLEKFFSIEYAGRSDLFEGLDIWKDEKYRDLQGIYPVISLSFANIKEKNYDDARRKICQLITDEYVKKIFLLEADCLAEVEKESFRRKTIDMDDVDATLALYQLSLYLSRYYGRKVIILLDEYDTPMQEAYVNGYWEEMVSFTRSLFNSTFKTNPCLNRAVMTGITRISKESVFSDLNNLQVVATTSEKYADCFGFTEEEVFAALEEYGLSDLKQQVKTWYDGFSFGKRRDIYNPWSIISFLGERKVGVYWANTSSNSLAGKLIQEGSPDVKTQFEHLLQGESIRVEIDEQIVYDQLSTKKDAVWSLLLASGYLKIKKYEEYVTEYGEWKTDYELELTNFEVRVMFGNMVRGWFDRAYFNYSNFIKALLLGDVKAMNIYMNKVTAEMFSYFDTGQNQSGGEPERFYHGFVLGLMMELTDKYVITSNRESGFGRYDVMLEPRKENQDAILLEFKVQEEEESLSDTAEAALKQIDERNYQAALYAKGIPDERIRKYGFAFCGKKVLIKSWIPDKPCSR